MKIVVDKKCDWVIGAVVEKFKAYSDESYVKYGGREYQLPLGSRGVIRTIIDDNTYWVLFSNGLDWKVDKSEIKLI